MFSNSSLGSSYEVEFCTNLVLLSVSLFKWNFPSLSNSKEKSDSATISFDQTMIKTLEMMYCLEEWLNFFFSVLAQLLIMCEIVLRDEKELKVSIKYFLKINFQGWMQHFVFIKPIDVSFILFSVCEGFPLFLTAFYLHAMETFTFYC